MSHNRARPVNFKKIRGNRSKNYYLFIIYCVIVGTNISKGNNYFVTYSNNNNACYYITSSCTNVRLLMLLKSAFVTQSRFLILILLILNFNIVVLNLSYKGRK